MRTETKLQRTLIFPTEHRKKFNARNLRFLSVNDSFKLKAFTGIFIWNLKFSSLGGRLETSLGMMEKAHDVKTSEIVEFTFHVQLFSFLLVLILSLLFSLQWKWESNSLRKTENTIFLLSSFIASTAVLALAIDSLNESQKFFAFVSPVSDVFGSFAFLCRMLLLVVCRDVYSWFWRNSQSSNKTVSLVLTQIEWNIRQVSRFYRRNLQLISTIHLAMIFANCCFQREF